LRIADASIMPILKAADRVLKDAAAAT
jgi:hypothetical protein